MFTCDKIVQPENLAKTESNRCYFLRLITGKSFRREGYRRRGYHTSAPLYFTKNELEGMLYGTDPEGTWIRKNRTCRGNLITQEIEEKWYVKQD